MLDEAYGQHVGPMSHKADDPCTCRACIREPSKHAYAYCDKGMFRQLSLRTVTDPCLIDFPRYLAIEVQLAAEIHPLVALQL